VDHAFAGPRLTQLAGQEVDPADLTFRHFDHRDRDATMTHGQLHGRPSDLGHLPHKVHEEGDALRHRGGPFCAAIGGRFVQRRPG